MKLCVFFKKILPLITFLFVLVGSLLPQETDSGGDELLDKLKNKSDISLLYTIEYGTIDAKAKCFEVFSTKEVIEPAVLKAAHQYLTFGYNEIFGTLQYANNAWTVRYWASETISVAKSTESVLYLISLLEYENETSVILSAVRTLGDIGSPNGVNVLIKFLRMHSDSPIIIYETINSLGKIGDERALPILIEIAENNFYKKMIRVKAANTIDLLKEPASPPKL